MLFYTITPAVVVVNSEFVGFAPGLRRELVFLFLTAIRKFSAEDEIVPRISNSRTDPFACRVARWFYFQTKNPNLGKFLRALD
jgi:hypothetical protein